MVNPLGRNHQLQPLGNRSKAAKTKESSLFSKVVVPNANANSLEGRAKLGGQDLGLQDRLWKAA